MADKHKHKLCTQLRPGLHDRIRLELLSYLDENQGEFHVDYLKSVVFSKYIGPGEDVAPADVRKSRAIEKWLKTELRNERTNIRLYSGGTNFGFTQSEDIIEYARRIVTKVIGESPGMDLLGSFSGGASTRYKRETGASARKFTGQADVTEEAWPFILPLLLQESGWLHHNPEVLYPRIVVGNVMFTVPKSSMIDRVACKEPDLNMFAQKACGDFFRRRLQRFGIDLNDQSVNKNLARQGSISGKLATIDLSSASDSVTTSLVARLLPPSWFVLLDAIRCKRTVIGEDVHENEMFSSMGNGFTFELESLLFYVLARAIAYFKGIRGKISVYGDDIIVPVELAHSLTKCFGYFGFLVNLSKSHVDGHFRESCGGHYYRGADVTPFYIKEPIDNVERLIHFLNRLRKWSGQDESGICDPRFEPLWTKYAAYVDRRLWGGSNVADPSQLVARRKPRFKLVRKSIDTRKLVEELQLGMYLQTLNALGHRKVAAQTEVARRGIRLLPCDILWAKTTKFVAESSTLKTDAPGWLLRRASPRITLGDFPVWQQPEGTL